jgi:CopG family transcriptional regulator/antitoxin EndoAI
MKASMHQRVNITLSSRTLRRIDRVAERGDRSRLIDAAINFYIGRRNRADVRKLLKEGASARAERDRVMAADWFDLDDIWEKRAR